MNTNKLSNPDEISAALTRIGLRGADASFIAVGASSEAWDVHHGADRFVMRIYRSDHGHPSLYEFEFGVRMRLRKLTNRIAEPIATNRDVQSSSPDGLSRDWILDRFVEGSFVGRGENPERVCRELGETLAALHTLDCKGYGEPMNRRDSIVGLAEHPIESMFSRFQEPWPFAEGSLATHPVAAMAPHLMERIELVGTVAVSSLKEASTVINHSDLHNEQMIIADESLGALIDFGDPLIGSPAWDIASFMYFHGEVQTAWLLSGYTSDRSLRDSLRDTAKAFASVIAMHHVKRSFVINRPSRREFAIARLAGLLESTPLR